MAISEVFKRYTPKDINIGVLQKNYFKEQGFVSFKGSTYNHNSNNETVVVENNGKLWESDNKNNSYFIINFSKNILRLSSVSMLSCKGIDCVYNLEIYGSNNGDEWEIACKIQK